MRPIKTLSENVTVKVESSNEKTIIIILIVIVALITIIATFFLARLCVKRQ